MIPRFLLKLIYSFSTISCPTIDERKDVRLWSLLSTGIQGEMGGGAAPFMINSTSCISYKGASPDTGFNLSLRVKKKLS